jgi:hypothetical protein
MPEILVTLADRPPQPHAPAVRLLDPVASGIDISALRLVDPNYAYNAADRIIGAIDLAKIGPPFDDQATFGEFDFRMDGAAMKGEIPFRVRRKTMPQWPTVGTMWLTGVSTVLPGGGVRFQPYEAVVNPLEGHTYFSRAVQGRTPQ